MCEIPKELYIFQKDSKNNDDNIKLYKLAINLYDKVVPFDEM